VRTHGLLGVAIGTLVPIVGVGALVVFPAGCRRLAVPIGRALREAIWPAVWPVAVMAGFSVATAPFVGVTLVQVSLHMAATAAVYGLTFALLAVSSGERRFFMARAKQLLGRPGRPAAMPLTSEGA
jgi:hypothetical protein